MDRRGKAFVEALLVTGGLTRLTRLLNRRRRLVLAYHNIVPTGSAAVGDLPLHLAQRSFASQLDLISRTHEVVPLDRLFHPSSVRLNRPRVAITFDDAYSGALTAGIEELSSRRLPATIFVATSFVGGRSFWWDRHAGRAGLSPAFRERVLTALRGEDSAVLAMERTEGIEVTEPPSHARCATELELDSAARVPGITVGCHTVSHPNLQELDTQRVEEELAHSMDWLRVRFTELIPWVSYPYGLMPACIPEIARSAGLEAGLLVAGGHAPHNVESTFSIPRVNISSGHSANGFEIRTSGLLRR